MPVASKNTVLTCVRQCVLTALLGQRNKLNQTTNQQLISACVVLHLSSVTNKTKADRRTMLALRKTQQETWLANYRLLPILVTPILDRNLTKLYWLDQAQQVFVLSLCLCRYAEAAKLTLSQQMMQLVRLTPRSWHQQLRSLCEYPSLMPPGSLVKKQDGSLHLILSLAKIGYLSKQIKPRIDEDSGFIGSNEKVTLLRTLSITHLNQLDSWWSEDWQALRQKQEDGITASSPSFRLDTPPQSLLAIHRALQQDKVDVKKVSTAIEAEPLFADHLKQSASQASRLNITMKDAKHGLMMQGFGRTSDLLMRQALMLRINQHRFPLQQPFLQFVTLRAQLAALLSQELLGKVYVEEAKTLATFASVGLFTLAELKTLQSWHTANQLSYDINYLIGSRGSNQINEHGIKLAKAWQQTSQHIQAIQLHNRLPNTFKKLNGTARWACILGISLVLAKRGWFAKAVEDAKTKAYMFEAAKLFNVSQLDFQEFLRQAMVISRSHGTLLYPSDVSG